MSARTFQLVEKKKKSSFPPRGRFVVFFKSGQRSEFLILFGVFFSSSTNTHFYVLSSCFQITLTKFFDKTGSVFPIA